MRYVGLAFGLGAVLAYRAHRRYVARAQLEDQIAQLHTQLTDNLRRVVAMNGGSIRDESPHY